MTTEIRSSCFRPFHNWQPPSHDEIRALLAIGKLTGAAAGDIVGVNGRTVRRWTSGEVPIPYSAWALLCDAVGYVRIWRR